MLETADRLVVEEGEPSVQQYQLLVAALRVLNQGTSDGPRPASMILDSYLLRALAVAGYAPSFTDCARCGLVGPHTGFSPAVGGVVCERCRPAGSARPSPDTLRLLGALLEGRWPATRDASAGGPARGERAHVGVPDLASGPRPAITCACRTLIRTGRRRPSTAQDASRTCSPSCCRCCSWPRWPSRLAVLWGTRSAGSGEPDPGGPVAAGGPQRAAGGRRPVLPRLRQQRVRRREVRDRRRLGSGLGRRSSGTTTMVARASQTLDSFYVDLALDAERATVDGLAGPTGEAGLPGPSRSLRRSRSRAGPTSRS